MYSGAFTIAYFTCEATAQGRLASVPSSTSSSSSSSSKSPSSFGGDAISGKITDKVGKRSLFFTSACNEQNYFAKG